MVNLFIPTKNNEVQNVIATHEIIRCEASNNYTWFYLTNNRKVLASRTLGNYEDSLIENDFVRIHRKNITNKLFISKIENHKIVQLIDGSCFAISRRRRKTVDEILLSV